MHDLVNEFRPMVVAVDPINNLSIDRLEAQVKPTLMRLIDFLKQRQITAVFTSLSAGEGSTMPEITEVGVSSLMDTWLLLRNVEINGERNRTLYVMKSRGMRHSNQVREFLLSDSGIDLVDVYLGAEQVLTGTARVAQVAQERAAMELRKHDHDRKLRQLASRRKALEAQIAALQAEAETEAAEERFAVAEAALQESITRQSTEAISELRKADVAFKK
jgi:circadian clock protein KaiC